MNRSVFKFWLGTLTFLFFMGTPMASSAGVSVNVGINLPPPPPLLIPAPPPVFVIPQTYVYYPPEVDADIFFYHGYWYRPHQGHWYRSGSYNGKWVYVAPKKVPSALINLPPDFRRIPPGHQHIPYGHLKKNWKSWERDKYWDKHGGKEWHGEKWEHDREKGNGKGKGKGKHNG